MISTSPTMTTGDHLAYLVVRVPRSTVPKRHDLVYRNRFYFHTGLPLLCFDHWMIVRLPALQNDHVLSETKAQTGPRMRARDVFFLLVGPLLSPLYDSRCRNSRPISALGNTSRGRTFGSRLWFPKNINESSTLVKFAAFPIVLRVYLHLGLKAAGVDKSRSV